MLAHQFPFLRHKRPSDHLDFHCKNNGVQANVGCTFAQFRK